MILTGSWAFLSLTAFAAQFRELLVKGRRGRGAWCRPSAEWALIPQLQSTAVKADPA